MASPVRRVEHDIDHSVVFDTRLETGMSSLSVPSGYRSLRSRGCGHLAGTPVTARSLFRQRWGGPLRVLGEAVAGGTERHERDQQAPERADRHHGSDSVPSDPSHFMELLANAAEPGAVIRKSSSLDRVVE